MGQMYAYAGHRWFEMATWIFSLHQAKSLGGQLENATRNDDDVGNDNAIHQMERNIK